MEPSSPTSAPTHGVIGDVRAALGSSWVGRPAAQDRLGTREARDLGVFAVVVSLLRILLTMIGTMTHGQPVPPVGPSEFEQALSRATDYERALARGDLLLIAGALAAGGLGEIVARGTHRNLEHRIFAGGMAIGIVIVSTWWFADISSSIARDEVLDLAVIAWGSVTLFCGSVLTAGSCIWLAET